MSRSPNACSWLFPLFLLFLFCYLFLWEEVGRGQRQGVWNLVFIKNIVHVYNEISPYLSPLLLSTTFHSPLNILSSQLRAFFLIAPKSSLPINTQMWGHPLEHWPNSHTKRILPACLLIASNCQERQ